MMKRVQVFAKEALSILQMKQRRQIAKETYAAMYGESFDRLYKNSGIPDIATQMDLPDLSRKVHKM